MKLEASAIFLEIRKISKRDITSESGYFFESFSTSEISFPLDKLEIED